VAGFVERRDLMPPAWRTSPDSALPIPCLASPQHSPQMSWAAVASMVSVSPSQGLQRVPSLPHLDPGVGAELREAWGLTFEGR
jgi:hypothetical protein